MKVLILGAGSVGLGLASCLLKSGCDVTLVGRQATVDQLRTDGLIRTGMFGNVRFPPPRFSAAASVAVVKDGPFQYVLVCVKSFDTDAAARELKAAPGVLGASTRYVLCQNGYGNAEAFSAAFPPERVFPARIITGFRRLSLNHVEITVHAAPILVGSLLAGRSEDMEELARPISEGGIPAKVSADIGKDLWAKILYNLLLNPLGALLGVPYGELAKAGSSRRIMARVAHEAFAVMHANGHSTHWSRAEDFLADFYGVALPPTAAHESSMLQDIRAGKRTEIEALSGAVARLGAKAGVPTPVNETLANLVRFLEARKGEQPSPQR